MIYYLSYPYSLIEDKDELMKQISQIRFKLEQRDLTIFSPLCHNHLHTLNIPEQTHAFWMKQDLEMIEGLMNHDGWVPENKVTGTEIYYDSGVVMLLPYIAYSFLPSQLKNVYLKKDTFEKPYDWNHYWNSKGCKLEYEYCKERYIKVLDLDAFIQERELEL